MTARGGRRVPDGQPRPKPVPFGQGPNRTDLSQLPGTPGTELPSGIAEPVPYGQVGRVQRALSGLPIQAAMPPAIGGKGILTGPTQAPNEPVTAGIARGPGPGPEALIPTPNDLSSTIAASELKWVYPVLMRLATMAGATTQTKILAQRLRANLPVQPEQMPRIPKGVKGGVPRQT